MHVKGSLGIIYERKDFRNRAPESLACNSYVPRHPITLIPVSFHNHTHPRLSMSASLHSVIILSLNLPSAMVIYPTKTVYPQTQLTGCYSLSSSSVSCTVPQKMSLREGHINYQGNLRRKNRMWYII